MARAELKVHADRSDGIGISVIENEGGWEFRTTADGATIAKPGYPECLALIVQIGDHLSTQFDVKGWEQKAAIKSMRAPPVTGS
jgi:hypothetical protein